MRMRGLYGVLASALLLVALPVPTASASGAARTEGPEVVVAGEAPSPSPSLGSVQHRTAELPGTADDDAHDFEKTYLAVVSFLFLAFLVGGSLLFYLWRRSRTTREVVRERHVSSSD
jgi:hypothetical protein